MTKETYDTPIGMLKTLTIKEIKAFKNIFKILTLTDGEVAFHITKKQAIEIFKSLDFKVIYTTNYPNDTLYIN